MLTRLLLIFVLVAGLGGFGAFSWIATHQPAAAPAVAATAAPAVELRSVLVSAGALHAGRLLRPDDLSSRDFPSNALPPGAVIDGGPARRSLVGALLRASIPAGGLVLSQDLVLPGDHGYLSAVLEPNKRAVSIGVDAVSGVAGLVWPGDYVDLILSLSLDDPGVPLGHHMAAETVLTGLRVLATNQDLIRGEKPTGVAEDGRTVTLEATPAEAQRIQIASRLGHLSLSVCPLADCSAPHPVDAVTWSSDLSAAMARSTSNTDPHKQTVHLFDGSSDQKDFEFKQ